MKKVEVRSKKLELAAGALALLVVLAVPASLTAGKSDVADAAMRGNVAVVRALIGQKADVNAPQNDGATALHWAVYHGDREKIGRAHV